MGFSLQMWDLKIHLPPIDDGRLLGFSLQMWDLKLVVNK